MDNPTGVWGYKSFFFLKCNTRKDNSSWISYRELIYLLYFLLNYKQIIKEETFTGEEGKRKTILECEAGSSWKWFAQLRTKMLKDSMTEKDTLGMGNRGQSRVKTRRQEDVNVTFQAGSENMEYISHQIGILLIFLIKRPDNMSFVVS